MTVVVYIAVYCALAIFAIGCFRRAMQYSKLPAHLRWELYPVPHEPSPRAAHGGSYFEDSEWWTRPRKVNRLGELRVMVREIFLLETVRKSNQALWWRSQMFHSGVFLLIAAIGCDFLTLAAPRLTALGRAAGYLGLLLILMGSLALLWRRIAEGELDDYTHPADFAQLSALAVAALLLLLGCLDPAAPSIRQFANSAATFDSKLNVPGVLAAGMLLTAALIAYIPFSRMAHFIGKYFGYHAVRWDDEPNRGGHRSQALAANLSLKPTWSARHIAADGTRSWAEIAAENPTGVRR
jgi:nitrate reductase gamma subunit